MTERQYLHPQAAGHMLRFAGNEENWQFWLDVVRCPSNDHFPLFKYAAMCQHRLILLYFSH